MYLKQMIKTMRSAFPILALSFFLSRGCNESLADASKMGVREFLASPPAFTRMVFARDAASMLVNGKPASGHLYYEAAWQEETFFVRHITNAPLQPRNAVSWGQIVGKTASELAWEVNWMLPQGVVMSAPAKEMDSQSVSMGAKHAYDGLLLLNKFRGLGMWLLQPGSLSWLDDTRFEATATIPSTVKPEDPRTGKLTGRIVAVDDQKRPLRIDFSTSLNLGIKNMKMAVEFDYNKPVGETDLPSRFVLIREFDVPGIFGAHQAERETNLIEHVELGRFIGDQEGYTPGMFLPISTNSARPLVSFATNGFNFQVTDRGLIPTGNAPQRTFKGSSARVVPVWLAIGAVAIGCFGLALRKSKLNKSGATT